MANIVCNFPLQRECVRVAGLIVQMSICQRPTATDRSLVESCQLGLLHLGAHYGALCRVCVCMSMCDIFIATRARESGQRIEWCGL